MAQETDDDDGSATVVKSPPHTPQKKDSNQDLGSIPSAEDGEGEEEEEEEEDEDEEPRLKYVPLTKNQGSLYRNGDAVSAFLVGGDKMVREKQIMHHNQTTDLGIR